MNKGERLSTKLTHRHVADIKGSGPFPIDMLRYDRAAPYQERDSHQIENSLNPMIERRAWVIRIVRYSDSTPGWGVARWNSFHCELTVVSEYDERPVPAPRAWLAALGTISLAHQTQEFSGQCMYCGLAQPWATVSVCTGRTDYTATQEFEDCAAGTTLRILRSEGDEFVCQVLPDGPERTYGMADIRHALGKGILVSTPRVDWAAKLREFVGSQAEVTEAEFEQGVTNAALSIQPLLDSESPCATCGNLHAGSCSAFAI